MKIKRTPLNLSALAGICLLLAGCFEETDTVTVNADGSGVIHLHKKLGEGFSQMITSNGTAPDMQAAVNKPLYQDLGLWNGMTAWTGCKAALDGKFVTYDADGYFADVNALKRTEGTTVQAFSWSKNADGGFTLSWTSTDTSNPKPLDQPASPPAQTQQMLAMVKGLKLDHVVNLPGAVLSAAGADKKQGRLAAAGRTDKDIADFYALLDDYRARLAKGEIAKATADAEIADKLKSLSMNLTVTCGPAAGDGGLADFKKAFDAAKADYAAAGTAGKILAANKK